MKKTLILLMLAFAVFSLFVSCDSSVKEPATYTVTLIYDEETSESFKILDGEKFVLPESKGDKAIASYKDSEATYTAGKRIDVRKDMILTAVFKTEPTPSEKTYYSVVVISKDTVVDSQIIESGQKYKLPAAPEGTGFKGWQVGDDTTLKTAGAEIEITANTAVRAVFEAEPVKEYFTLVVISKDSVVDTAYLEKDSEYTLPAAPEGTGFNGWKVGDDTELKKAGTKITITADTTVKADWEAEPVKEYFTVVVISKDSVVETKSIEKGTEYTLPAAPDGTGFNGWKVGDDAEPKEAGTKITITADTTVKAVFEAEKAKEYFTLVVISNDSVVDTAYLEKGSEYTLPAAPEGTGFNGWKVGDDAESKKAGTKITITADTTVKAVWTEEAAPVYYSLVVISKEDVVESKYVVSGTKYTLPANSEARFKTWSVNGAENAAGTKITVSANTTVKAVFEEEAVKEYFTVVVISKDSVVETKSIEKGTEYTLPAAPEGTGFNGWKVGDDAELKKAGTKITITADTTVKADWTADPEPVYYSLTVISKETVIKSEAVESGTKYTLPENNETGFKNWKIGETTKKAGDEITVSEDTTVLAVFEEATPVTYYAVVVLNKDTLLESKTVAGNSTYSLPSAPSGDGTFNGWLVGDSTSPTDAGATITISKDTVIKADWTADPAPAYYSLTVISKETVIKSEAVESGTTYTLPTNSETGFEGWKVGEETTLKEAGTVITVSSDTTVKAVFKAETPVTYYAVVVLNGDALVDSKAVAGNSTYTLPTAPSGEGTFKGWKIGEATELEAAGADITINGNTTITAEWGAAEPAAYKIGDTGPGGGIIFYVADTLQESKYTDSSGAEHKLEWKYLEIAKADVSTSTTSWGTSAVSGTGTGIGTGWSNTKLINASGISNFPAAQACTTYSNNGYSDWFLPSYDELALIYTNIYSNSEISAETKALFETTNYYWTSSIMAGNYAYRGYFTSSYSDTSGAPISMNMYYVRPIRAFDDTGSSSETITPASDYTVGGTVYLGTYPTDGKAISWKVLEVDTDNSRALVISENILEKRAWEDEYTSYAGSGIQEYLNDSDTGFIFKYGLKNSLTNICSVDCNGENTNMSEGSSEKVFLLSEKELNDNFTTISKIANYQGSASAWWLRTFGDSSKPEYVDALGAIGSQDSSNESGVRPAMWVTF